MVNMDFISSLSLLFFFFFFYYLGWNKDDFILELIGLIGLMILGLLIWSTGIQTNEFLVIGTEYVFKEATITGSEITGLLIFLFSCFLLFYCFKTIAEMRK